LLATTSTAALAASMMGNLSMLMGSCVAHSK